MLKAKHKKICSICNRSKVLEPSGVCWKCHEELSVHMPSSNPEDNEDIRKEIILAVRSCGGDLKEYIKQRKMEVGCQVCGYDTTPRSVHFHHFDPKSKKFGLFQVPARAKTIKLYHVIQEIKKGCFLCANCHGEVHDGLYTTEELKHIIKLGPIR